MRMNIYILYPTFFFSLFQSSTPTIKMAPTTTILMLLLPLGQATHIELVSLPSSTEHLATMAEVCLFFFFFVHLADSDC